MSGRSVSSLAETTAIGAAAASDDRAKFVLLGNMAAEPAADLARLPVRARAVLAYLAAHSETVVTRATLSELIWTGRGEPQARQSLNQALVAIRRCLGAANHPAAILNAGPGGLCLGGAAVDVAEFEPMFRNAAGAKLQEALENYRGPFLHGFPVVLAEFDGWVRAERARLHDLAVSALERYVEAALGTGSSDQATRLCQQFIALDPLREDVHRLLLNCYIASGSERQALQHYQLYAAELKRELGMLPDARTRALIDGLAHVIEPEATIGNPNGSAAGASTRPLRRSLRPGPLAGWAAGALLVIAAAFSAVQTFGWTPAAPLNTGRYEFSPLVALNETPAARILAQSLSERLQQGLTGVPGLDLAANNDGAQARFTINGTVSVGDASARVDLRVTDKSDNHVVIAFGADIPKAPIPDMTERFAGRVGNALTAHVNRVALALPEHRPSDSPAAALLREARSYALLTSARDQTLQKLANAVALAPEDPDIVAAEIDALLSPADWMGLTPIDRTNALKKANGLLNLALRRYPRHRLLIYLDCRVALLQSMGDKAALRCEDAVRTAPFLARAHYQRGLALLLQQRLERAVQSFITAEQLGGDDEIAWVWELAAGQVFLQLNKNESALAYLRKAAEKQHFGPLVHAMLAVALERGGDQDAARLEARRYRDAAGPSYIDADAISAEPGKRGGDYAATLAQINLTARNLITDH